MKISLIILTYNHANYIESCLESIKFQELNFNKNDEHKIQIIVSDDCSEDKTLDLILSWKKVNECYFEDFVVLRNSINKGTCSNLLGALEYVRNDYIKILGGDDLFINESLFDILRRLDDNDIVFGLPYIYETEGVNNYAIQKKFYEKLHCSYINAMNRRFYDIVRSWNILYAPAVFVRKDLLMDSRVIDAVEKYKYIEDKSMWFSMSEIKEIRHCYIPRFLVVYRRTPKSTYKQRGSELKEEMIRIYSYATRTARGLLNKIIMYNNVLHLNNRIHFSIGGIIFNLNWFLNRNSNQFLFSEQDNEKILLYIQSMGGR